MTTTFHAIAVCTAFMMLASPAVAADTTAGSPPSSDPQTTAPKPTVEDEIPASVLHSSKDNILNLTVENDMFGGGTDQNYTSGVRLTYTDINSTIPQFAHDIADIMPGFSVNETTSLFYSLGQNIFTPKDITSPVQNPKDRPWAAWLYGSMGMVTLTDNHTDEIELTVGMVGPAALGKEAQSFIHRHISGSPDPKGWDNQLKNEPGVMLGWQRAFPQYLSGDIGNGLFVSLAPYVGATIGNIYTYADVGFNIRLGPDSEKWQDTPVRVRPAMPGTGFFEIPEKKWSWYLFAGLEGRAVARDIFLDGNTFEDSYSIDKNVFVGDANAGFALTYDQFRISYTAVYRTREFESQTSPEVFGAINVGYRF